MVHLSVLHLKEPNLGVQVALVEEVVVEGRRGSQDSLASTGSNQDLRTELASALAEVRAVVEEVVQLQASPEVEELVGRPAGSREGVGRQVSGEEVRRERSPSSSSSASSRKVSGELGARTKTPAVTPRSSRGEPRVEEGVVLKQASWGSRHGKEEREEGGNSFLKHRDLWERRTTSTPTSDEDAPRAGGPQGVRGFWESRTNTPTTTNRNPKHTPDLVMDLPQGALASSPPVPAPRPGHLRRCSRSPSSDSSLASDASPPSTSPSVTTADNFAADTDTLRKTSAGPVAKPRPAPLAMPEATRGPILPSSPRSQVLPIRSPGPRGGAAPGSPFHSSFASSPSTFSPAGSSFKPAVKVKPLLQVKPTEVKKEETKK